MNYEGIIAEIKKKMVFDLLETYPSMEYRSIKFERLRPNQRELCEAVEKFKCLDGRYYFDGDFVSRKQLEKELALKDYKIVMCAYVKEEIEAEDKNDGI
jgi:hypothetical protein